MMTPTPERTITPPYLDLDDSAPSCSKRALCDAALLEGLGSNKMKNKPPIMKHSMSMLEMNEIDDMKHFFDECEGGGGGGSLGDEGAGLLLGGDAAAGGGEDDFLFFDGEEDVGAASSSSSSPFASSAADNNTQISSSNDSSGSGGGMRRVQSMGAMAEGNKTFNLLASMAPDIHTIHEDDIEDDDDDNHNVSNNSREEQVVQVNFGDDGGDAKRSPPPSPSRKSSMKRESSSNSLRSSMSSSGHQLSSSQHSQPKKSAMKKSTSKSNMKRNISFSNLEIRSYNITAGDAPTPNGVPLSLDWEYDPNATQTIDVETYENNRGARRQKHEMFVPNQYRVYLLMREAGLSRQQIKMSIDDSQRAFKARQKTAKNLKMQPVEEALEKTRRKFSKLTRKVRI